MSCQNGCGVVEEKKGILELMWGDKKCESQGLSPHEVNPHNCGDCNDFDGGAICNWHREHSTHTMSDGAVMTPYMSFKRRNRGITVFLSGHGKC